MKPKFVGFEAVKRSVSIVQVLERYGLMPQLHRSRDHLTGVCPLHHGHNKTQFRVSISKNCWICFGDCHAGGSIVDFVSCKEGISIRDAALLIQDWFAVRSVNGKNKAKPIRPEVDSTPAVNKPLTFTLENLDKKHSYLSERGLTAKTIETFGVGLCKRGLFKDWIVIPIHNAAGRLVAYAGRSPGTPPDNQPKYKLPRGFRKSLEVFNLHRALAANHSLPLVVVEGFFGCMKVWQAGYHRTVSLMGSMLSREQKDIIVKAAGENGEVILLFDEDEAGRKGCTDARRRLAENVKVRVVSLAGKGRQPDQLTPGQLNELLGFSPS